MIDAVVVAGPGFKAPSLERIRTNLLLESVEDAMLVLSEFHSSWVETGCTIMSDGWTDQRNRNLINLLVSCPVGRMFLKSMDALEKVKTTQLICEMMEEVVQEVGEEHVVQIVTDNAANYMAVGRLFEIRHPIIFWTYCVAHCIDLMLEDIDKSQEDVLGPEWMASKHSKTLEGIEVVTLVFNDDFWKDAEEIIAVMESLVRVLRMVDGDKPAMGYIYEAMDPRKEAIKRRYGHEEAKYKPLWYIIYARWDRKLHSPLHATRYFLNP
eukprot:PITA_05402